MARTGVEVTTALSAGRRSTGVPSARYHLAGVTERGPVGVAQRVTSIAEFRSYFGGRTSKSDKTYSDAMLFFAERGSELYMTRVVGPAASRGSVTLNDTAGASTPTLRVTLNEPGSYSTKTSVGITTTAGNTFTFSVYQENILKVRFTGLTSPTDLVARTLGHPLITVTDLGSPTASPGNNPVATPEPVVMSEGTDDFINVTTDSYIDALNETGEATRGGMVSVVDLPLDVIGEGLIAHAVDFNQVAILTAEVDTTAEEVALDATALHGVEGSDHAMILWPHVVLKDEDSGGFRYVAPAGYGAAARARAHTANGYWQIPAGERSAATAIQGLRFPVDTRLNNLLADSYVSGIIQDAGQVKIYNWWSLSPDRNNFRYLSVRDELNNIAMDLASEFRQFIFSTWDSQGKLLNQISSAAKGVMATLAERDAVSAGINPTTGETTDPGYKITVDAPINSNEQNVVVVRVEVRTPQTAQLIQVEIVRVPLDATL